MTFFQKATKMAIFLCVKRAFPQILQEFFFGKYIVELINSSSARRANPHPLENFNDNIRDIAHNNDTINSTPHIVARAHLQKCLKNELGLNNTKRTRINAGGIRLSESLNIIKPPEVEPTEVVESLFCMANGATKETIMKKRVSGKSLELFFEFIENAIVVTDKNKCMPAFDIPHPSRNATIDNRNFAFSNAFA